MTLLVILYDMMEQVAAKKHENEMKTNVKMKASYASHNMNSMQVAAVVVRIGGGRPPLRRSRRLLTSPALLFRGSAERWIYGMQMRLGRELSRGKDSLEVLKGVQHSTIPPPPNICSQIFTTGAPFPRVPNA